MVSEVPCVNRLFKSPSHSKIVTTSDKVGYKVQEREAETLHHLSCYLKWTYLAVGLEKVKPACRAAGGAVEVGSARASSARALDARHARGAAAVDYYQAS